jgi:flagellar biogenesis protein FliO
MKQLEHYWWVLAIGAALVLLIVLGLIWLVSRMFRRKPS